MSKQTLPATTASAPSPDDTAMQWPVMDMHGPGQIRVAPVMLTHGHGAIPMEASSVSNPAAATRHGVPIGPVHAFVDAISDRPAASHTNAFNAGPSHVGWPQSPADRPPRAGPGAAPPRARLAARSVIDFAVRAVHTYVPSFPSALDPRDASRLQQPLVGAPCSHDRPHGASPVCVGSTSFAPGTAARQTVQGDGATADASQVSSADSVATHTSTCTAPAVPALAYVLCARPELGAALQTLTMSAHPHQSGVAAVEALLTRSVDARAFLDSLLPVLGASPPRDAAVHEALVCALDEHVRHAHRVHASRQSRWPLALEDVPWPAATGPTWPSAATGPSAGVPQGVLSACVDAWLTHGVRHWPEGPNEL